MKGVCVLRDGSTNKRIIQIDVEEIDPADELPGDLVDIILADTKDDEKHGAQGQ